MSLAVAQPVSPIPSALKRNRSCLSLCYQYHQDLWSAPVYRANAMLYLASYVGEGLMAGGIRLAACGMVGNINVYKNILFKSAEQFVYLSAGIHAASFRAQDVPAPKEELHSRLQHAARNDLLTAGLFVGSIALAGAGGACLLGACALFVRSIQAGKRYHRNGVWSASRDHFYPPMRTSTLGPIAGALEQSVGMIFHVALSDGLVVLNVAHIAAWASALIVLGATIGIGAHIIMARRLAGTGE